MMLNKFLTKTNRHAQVLCVKPLFSAQPTRLFSAEGAAEPTQQEKDNARIEWTIKYDEECLKFE